MPETQWIKACGEKDLAEGVPMLAQAGDESVYLVRFGEKVYAVGHECPHYQCKLEEGILLGRTVVCRCHNARFDVTTGKMVSPPALNDLPVYPVKVESGEVFVGPVKKPRFPIPGGVDPRAFLIMGAGAAGNAAAETLRREGFTGRVVMITPEEDLPYDRPNLSKEFLSGAAKPEWLPLRSAKFYAERGIEVMTRRRVTAQEEGDIRRGRDVFLRQGAVGHGGNAAPALHSRSGGFLLLRSAQSLGRQGHCEGRRGSEERARHRGGFHRHGGRGLAS